MSGTLTRRARVVLGATLGAAALGLLALGAARAAPESDTTKPVRIGILNDQSGTYADFGGRGSVVAAQMAIDDFGGSVLGRKIVLLSADHQNKPDTGVAIARQWFDADAVDMIGELTTSSVALAVQDLAKAKGKIDIVVGAATSKLTNEACSPTGFHWAYDTYALARGTGGALVESGGKSWFFITADYAFGHQLEKDTTDFVTAKGGTVVGAVNAPFQNSDFSSFLLQAQASKAQVIGLANAGTDTTNAIKQAAEFGITKGGQKLAGLLFTLSDVHALGLKTAQGLVLTEAFYWDRDDASRQWAERYFQKMKRMPNMIQAGTYSSVLHYLKAVKAAGTTDAKAVAAKMRELPVDDMFAKGTVREDGTMVHDMYLFEVKKPEESKKPWDYYKLLRTIPGEEAYQAQDKGACPLTKKAS
ncbi:ABC transporter substrate-binding protein [Nitrospirillum viridazoti]|uniref:Amino acid/amide ABC transporter substrate-binding protein (HAAT family) n=1 Tax=Nitrospirillum amazonense TaxID=28077 RepID=A0A560I2C4_9PROT|nr:ABC transporter substrate-binding protein [Nitrospirillum amazonense]TWB52705.1 amino acid/amide ABC transporter substrate-binding protein (HAAT family) [Nitrospirillum amazonense]